MTEMPQLVAIAEPPLMIVAKAVAVVPSLTERLLGRTAATKDDCEGIRFVAVNSFV